MSKKETYGCVMLFLNPYDVINIEIDEEDLYFSDDPNQYWIGGREHNPHVTVLYGLHNDINHNSVVEFIKGLEVPVINFDDLDVSEQDDYDVLVYKVSGKTLHTNNTELRDKFDYTTDYPDYKPHCTVAYLKKGTAKKYLDNYNKFSAKPTKWVYSLKDGKEYNIQVLSKDVVENINRIKRLLL